MIKKISKIYYLLLLSVIFKIILFSYFYVTNDLSVFHVKDTVTYISPVISFIDNGVYNNTWGDPELSRPPGYPFILSIGYIFNNTEIVTILLQVLLSTVTLLFTYKISMIVTSNERTSLLAVLLLSFEPLAIVFSTGLLLAETALSMFTVLSIYFAILFFKTGNIRMIILSSIFLVAAVYMKPIVMFLPIVISVYFIIKNRSLWAILSYLLIFFIFISFWSIRNHSLAEQYTFSNISDKSVSFNALAVLQLKHVKDASFLYASIPSLIKFEEGEFNNNQKNEEHYKEDINIFKQEKYAEIFLNNVLNSSKVYLAGLGRMMLGTGLSDYFNLLNIKFNNSDIFNSAKHGYSAFYTTLKNNYIAIIFNISFLSILFYTYYFFFN
jgi:4-amino-4-deoxy-L-arabinose transferase-like glycosyltransferase